MNEKTPNKNEAWRQIEVDVVIVFYFQVRIQELTEQIYNKTTHRNALLAKLNNRTRAAVEFKHQNISAVVAALMRWYPYHRQYRPSHTVDLALTPTRLRERNVSLCW